METVAEFVTSAAGAGDFPRDRLAEVAMVGRSNVGKSSLINALAGRTVARTSAAPGKTRLANFYRVQRGSARALYLVDLPGYGYARGAPRQARPSRASGRPELVEGRGGLSSSKAGDAAAREFNRLTAAYFARADRRGGPSRLRQGSGEARRSAEGAEAAGPPGKRIAALLLVDSRHPGLESDLAAWAWLQTQPCPRAVIGTKVDKLTRADRARHARELETLFDTPVLLVSTQDGEGLEELWKLIVRLSSQTAA